MAAKKSRQRKPDRQVRYAQEFKLQAVKLYVEEGYTAPVVAEELGIGLSTLTAWARLYRERGEEGLRPRPPGKGMAKVSAAAKSSIGPTTTPATQRRNFAPGDTALGL